jgi:hypothetical protein
VQIRNLCPKISLDRYFLIFLIIYRYPGDFNEEESEGEDREEDNQDLKIDDNYEIYLLLNYYELLKIVQFMKQQLNQQQQR